MPPRIRVGERFRCTSSPEDGRFFATLRMTCFAMVISEMFRSHVCQHFHPEAARGKPCLRAYGSVKASAVRQPEKTGDSSTPLRMTWFAMAISEMFRSHVRSNCHAEAARGQPCLRAYGLVNAFAVRQTQKTGDSSTPLRMTCLAMAISEMFRSHVRQHFHPEAARGKPCLRAYGSVKASAVRQPEKTGDSSLRSE